MLCPKGIGLMALSSRAMERISLTTIGWQSVTDRLAFRRELDFLPTAAKFEPGTENLPGRFAIAERMAQIQRDGTAAIEVAVLDRRDQVAEALKSLGWQITSPNGAARSGIVAARHPGLAAQTIVHRLEESGVRTSARHGALRVSPHAYTNQDDIRWMVSVLSRPSLQ